ncbi:1-aminocyclopropane-1-carboxylate deaminase/D-cysteine desulfhydrase [Kangiella sp. HZ709]|uniref:1-aminocyclopropane-1-carboxylate deaminase/D-cysteine desulfhydrase n=1 Tax=Kangiella sp. HZ709 TaxID=2666328 RepID=UPI0012AF5AA7|nr:pyridoxal-phosphate dependent enzyme [Kangiella sp. HZ709]MRX28581.1 pyridoxal-phosphate dependent enzyme [Kangiella sp. HZ709]
MRDIKVPSPVEIFKHPIFDMNKISVDIKRDDLIHPIVSGNKWRKLKYLIQEAQRLGKSQVISMGGNYSNHLHALAYSAKAAGLVAKGFVRANSQQELTPTLRDCIDWGMELEFVSRNEYQALREQQNIKSFAEVEDSYWISEGGFSELAIKGVAEIAKEVDKHYDFILTATGSGATMVGLAKGFPNSKVIGVAAFKGASYLKDELSDYLPELENWSLDLEHHCGGFAKINAQLMQIKAEFEGYNGFKFDKVYNAKMIYALHDMVAGEEISPGSKVLLINTGGLQGDRI